ncbi:MAG: hypothetical protein WCO84_05935 [bacterium]
MAKIDLLRKIIREEVENALKKEMPKILKEIVASQPMKMTQASSLKEVAIKNPFQVSAPGLQKAPIPGTLNTRAFVPAQQAKFVGKDPLSQLLAETATSMGEEDNYAYGSEDVMADGMSYFNPGEAQLGSVDSMLSSAVPSSQPELVQINQVPDFTDLMAKMMAKGVI